MRSLWVLFCLMFCVPAWGQFDGLAPSPYSGAAQKNPLATLKIRLGAPVIPFGPTTNADVMPTFICPVPGSSPCYVFAANQAPWETTAASPLTGYSAADASSVSNGTTTPTTGYAVPAAGITTQVIGNNFNTGPPIGTQTVTSNWSQPLPDNALAALAPGTATDQCGTWPTSTFKVVTVWYLFAHNEGKCDYINGLGPGHIGFDNFSMSLWQSATAAPGSWTPVTGAGSPGTIISSQETVVAGQLVGVGDGTVIAGDDGYMYAYVTFFGPLPINDYQNAVARAPMTNLAPGNWMFLYSGCWCAPALNNPWDTTANLPHVDFIPYFGPAVASMPGSPYKALAIDGKDHAFWRHPPGQNIGGIALSISLDRKNFYTYPAPILNFDFQNFNGRPTPDDLYIYSILRDDITGGSSLSLTHAALWSVYIPPNNSLLSRYYVQWPATISQMTLPERLSGTPQFGVTLETWTNSSGGHPYSGRLRSTTVNPYPGITADGATEVGWAPTVSLGYMMTNCPGSTADVQACDSVGAQAANRIEECWHAADDDYGLQVDNNGTTGSCPGGWTHVRTAGWLYKSRQAFATKPIYACNNGGSGYHFASNDPTCGGQTVVGYLGEALAQ